MVKKSPRELQREAEREQAWQKSSEYQKKEGWDNYLLVGKWLFTPMALLMLACIVAFSVLRGKNPDAPYFSEESSPFENSSSVDTRSTTPLILMLSFALPVISFGLSMLYCCLKGRKHKTAFMQRYDAEMGLPAERYFAELEVVKDLEQEEQKEKAVNRVTFESLRLVSSSFANNFRTGTSSDAKDNPLGDFVKFPNEIIVKILDDATGGRWTGDKDFWKLKHVKGVKRKALAEAPQKNDLESGSKVQAEDQIPSVKPDEVKKTQEIAKEKQQKNAAIAAANQAETEEKALRGIKGKQEVTPAQSWQKSQPTKAKVNDNRKEWLATTRQAASAKSLSLSL